MSADDFDETISELWEKYVAEIRGRAPDIDVNLNPASDFDALLLEADIESSDAIRTAFPRELRMLDECLDWLGTLHLALHECLPSGQHPVSEPDDLNRVRSAWALVGFATTYGVALRKLACAGLDFPARVVLRSLREALQLCTVLVRRADLAGRYVQATEGGRLWYEELRPARLNLHLQAMEAEIPDIGLEIAATMSQSRRSSDDLDSEAAHPSYAAAFFAGFARSPNSPEVYRLATLGRLSLAHGRLLHRAASDIWHFATIGGNWLLVGEGSPIRSVMRRDYEERGLWNQIAIGRWVLIDAYLLELERRQKEGDI